MDKIFGILKLDYPSLSDDDFRQVQLGELDVLPDGKTVAEYTRQVEALKEAAVEAEAFERDLFIESVNSPKPAPQSKQEKAKDKKVEEPVAKDEPEA